LFTEFNNDKVVNKIYKKYF